MPIVLPCAVPDCPNSRYSGSMGWCSTHYKRWLLGQQIDAPILVWSPQTGVCAVPDCSKPKRSRDWCNIHYKRWQRYGDQLGGGVRHLRFPDNLYAGLDRSGGPSTCHLWTGRVNNEGYGPLSVGTGAPDLAHRAVYRLEVGPIPPGVVLDHTCHTNDPTCRGGKLDPHRRCGNVRHLEPVTNEENLRRGHAQRSAFADLMEELLATRRVKVDA